MIFQVIFLTSLISLSVVNGTPNNNNSDSSRGFGVTIADVCKTAYEEIEKDKKHHYVIFFIKDEKEIDVEVIGARDEEYGQFLTNLQSGGAQTCRYGLYDFEYQCQGTSESSKKQKLFLMNWCPDTATIQNKILYSSSFDVLK